MNLIIMGAPGAGKGTQSELISKREGIPAISTGQILRGAIKAGTELGVKAKSFMDAGALVPDEVVNGIIRDYLLSDDCRRGFILDGFPRTIAQAEALESMGVHIDAVLSIEVSDEKIIRRMSGRRVCECGMSYHTEYLPPKEEGICDKCGKPLTIRNDDAAETVAKRLETYHAQTEPVKEHYAALGKLRSVQGVGTVDEIRQRIFAALEL